MRRARSTSGLRQPGFCRHGCRPVGNLRKIRINPAEVFDAPAPGLDGVARKNSAPDGPDLVWSVRLFDEPIAAPDSEARGVIFARLKAEPAKLPPRPLPTMPLFNNGKRKEFTELRPRHLHMVEEYGFKEHGYDRAATRDYFLENYDKLFGRLRRKGQEVPNDEFRKYLIVFELLNLIDGRRAEYAMERAGTLRTTNI
jgi:hypothetical protein